MIIPRHKVCDFCENPVGVNKRYFVIKSKNYLVGFAGSCSDNKTHHICEDCMYRIISAIELEDFAKFVASEVCTNRFKENADSFAELACRKLVKLGLVELKDDTYSMKGEEE